jgi:nucleotide-binding universal stress UspA family protein
MSQTFIAAYDGSAASRAAVRFAVELARAEGAEVAAVHVYPALPPAGLRSRVFDKELEADLHAEGRTIIEGLDVEGVARRLLLAGRPAQALHELAEEEGASLIVVGATHQGHLGRAVPGSVGAKLIHGAPCPVCVAPADGTGPIRTIVVAYDEGVQSRAALREAERLARGLGAKLRIVAVQQLNVYAGPRGGAMTQFDQVVRDELDERVRAAADAIAGVTVETVTVIGEPTRVLTEAAAGADLVVTGSRGYGPLHSVLVGGVSRHLVDHAPCPVLVVPRDAEQPADRLAVDATAPSALT